MATPPPVKSKNKWVLFGCGGCLGLLVLLGLAGAGIFWFAMGALKKTDVFAETLKRAQASPEVQQALGSPIDTGWMLQGSMNVNNGNGVADLTFPLKGSKAEGSVRVKATQTATSPWQYSVMEAILPDGTVVDLRSDAEKEAAGNGTATVEPVEAEESAPEPAAKPEQ
jgi:hypothetical protein